MKRYNYIFWDWNGTLSNDVYAALASVNDILARRGRQSIDISRYYSLMATPITLFYERLFAPEKPDFSTLFREYHEGYALHMKEYGLADGAVETLKTLKSSGIRQAVISSSESGLLLKQIRSYGIEDMFDHIIGQDGFHAGSKLDSARDYINLSGIVSENILMIGDLEHDAEVAHSLGCSCLLYSGGHQARNVLEKQGYPVIDSISDALSYIIR